MSSLDQLTLILEPSFRFKLPSFGILTIKSSSKVLLTMAMAAIGLSTNLRDLKSIGYKPFVVGFTGMATVGLVSILTIELYINFLS